MKNSLFITGTDTGIGKTTGALLLLKALRDKLPTTHITYYKPVQTGIGLGTDSDYISKNLGNDINVALESYRFPEPISPNRAADIHNCSISMDTIEQDYKNIDSDICILEGAGGLQVPLGKKLRISSIPKRLKVPIIVVASTRLGTINHTLLTVDSAQRSGLTVKGIVLSGEKDPGLKELLEEQSGISVVGEIPWFGKEDRDSILKRASSFFQESFIDSLAEDCIWYPFTQHKLRSENLRVARGKGAWLHLENGQKIFDAISSWWVNIHGHGNRDIAKAVGKQAEELEHVILAGLSHEPAEALASGLIDLTTKCGGNFSKVFYSDNGSTAVEVALKMSCQYHQNRGDMRHRFLSLKGAYHGDTVGAMSVSEPDGFHKNFAHLLFPTDFVPPGDRDALGELEQNHPEQYAAFIVEPIVQGAGGMNFYESSYLQLLKSFCYRHGILLIFDEVFTGFGRLEQLFAFQQASVVPDILCVSKGITGGFLPMGATLATREIYEAFLSEKIEMAFLHGHSYTGNPIAASASLASMKILQSDECHRARVLIGETTRKRIHKLSQRKGIVNARFMGTIGAFNLEKMGGYFDSDFSYRFFKRAVEKGVLLRPLGNVIYTLPPYCSTVADINYVYDTIEQLVEEFTNG